MDSDLDPTAEAVQIRAIAEQDIERVTDMIARAFADDPVVNHLAKQDGKREERVRRFLRLALVPPTFPFGETYVAGGFEAAAYWNPPNQRPHGFWSDLRLLPHLIRVTGVGGLPRAIRCLDVLERKHPERTSGIPGYRKPGPWPDRIGLSDNRLMVLPTRTSEFFPTGSHGGDATRQRPPRLSMTISMPASGPVCWQAWSVSNPSCTPRSSASLQACSRTSTPRRWPARSPGRWRISR